MNRRKYRETDRKTGRLKTERPRYRNETGRLKDIKTGGLTLDKETDKQRQR